MSDLYLVVSKPHTAEIKVKGSRFIAEALPVNEEDEAQAAIAMIRKREYNANHYCTAYRLGPTGEVTRYNDDGEPSGTAGAPILRQIEARDLTNTLVVVTRYFGGTKLGTGGLIRAYGDAASAVLEEANVEERIIRTHVRVRFDYAYTSPAMHTIGQFDAPIVETLYSEDTVLVVAPRASEADAFIAQFIEALSGRCEVVMDGS